MVTHRTQRGRAVSFLTHYRKLLCAFIALFVLAGTATAAVAPEIKRRSDNETRLGLLHPYMRPKIAAVIADLEAHGDKPVIHSDNYRTPARQAQLKAQGRSTVSYSFHNVTDIDPKTKKRTLPASFAADVISYYQGYNVTNDFWLRLASSSESHGLTTGVYWGLPIMDRERIRQLIQSKAWTLTYRRGWDPAHNEPLPSVLTLSQAKAGKRPVVLRK